MDNQGSKYKMVSTDVVIGGQKMYQILALRDGKYFKNGDLGGYIGMEYNLSHDGDSWIDEGSICSSCGTVQGDAHISGNSCVSGCAWIGDRATITGGSQVTSTVKIMGDVIVDKGAVVSMVGYISGNARIYESIKNQYDFICIGPVGAPLKYITAYVSGYCVVSEVSGKDDVYIKFHELGMAQYEKENLGYLKEYLDKYFNFISETFYFKKYA